MSRAPTSPRSRIGLSGLVETVRNAEWQRPREPRTANNQLARPSVTDGHHGTGTGAEPSRAHHTPTGKIT